MLSSGAAFVTFHFRVVFAADNDGQESAMTKKSRLVFDELQRYLNRLCFRCLKRFRLKELKLHYVLNVMGVGQFGCNWVKFLQ